MLNLPVYLYTPAIRVFIDLDNFTKHGVDKMYHGKVTIAKGIKNTIRLNVVNGDQRSVSVATKAFYFDLFDTVSNKRIIHQPITVLSETTYPKGSLEVVLDGALTRDLKKGQYNYSILRDEGNGVLSPVFLDGASSISGGADVVDGIIERFTPSEEITFLLNQNNLWRAGPIASNRDGQGSNYAHTAQAYFTNFTGTLEVYGTLDTSPTTIAWALIDATGYTAFTGTAPYDLTGMFTYFKFEYTPVTGSVDKVLYRS